MERETARLRSEALAAWTAGLGAVSPQDCVRRALASRPELVAGAPGTLVVAAGKAAAGMLRGVFAGQPGGERPDRPRSQDRATARHDPYSAPRPHPTPIVLLPDGADCGEFPRPVLVLRGGHPFPTAQGVAATRHILEEVGRLGRGQRLLFLLSGGASALLEAPAQGLTVDDLVRTHRALVMSGLPIASINLVRGCLSSVKAGRLAQSAWPAEVTTLAISDVEGDDPATIGSGPTATPALSDRQRCRLALDVARDAALPLPAAVRRFLEASARETTPGTGKSGTGTHFLFGDTSLSATSASERDYTVIASVADAIAAARGQLQGRGVEVLQDEARLRGDTVAAAARVALAIANISPGGQGEPRALVFGGETTVAVAAGSCGRGGRNLDLAARLALVIDGRPDVALVVGGTDGCDGSSRAAGAVVDGGSAGRAMRAGLPLPAAIAAFDTEPALEAAGDLLVTGPTGTNVGDLVVVVAL